MNPEKFNPSTHEKDVLHDQTNTERLEQEIQNVPSQEEILALFKEEGFLDTSFEDKETHSLSIRSLSKKEVFDEYRKSGGSLGKKIDKGPASYNTPQEEIPYTTPGQKDLNVMIVKFNENVVLDRAVKEIDTMGARSLTYEELIQYGTEHPSHQEKNPLFSIDVKKLFHAGPVIPVLSYDVMRGRNLSVVKVPNYFDRRFRLLVVRK